MMTFSKYLNDNYAKGNIYTNTRIKGNDNGVDINGGKYNIADDKYEEFMKLYFDNVFIKKKSEYITEKQLVNDGPLLIDIDFRYDNTITSKQHSDDHIVDLIMFYADQISKYYNIDENNNIEIFILEKKHVNMHENFTKDGIHIIFCLKVCRELQMIIRNNIISEITNIWGDLPITNTWEDVFDLSITRGTTNWQLYGSKKPNNETYLLKQHYNIIYKDSEWEIEDYDINEFNLKDNIYKLSARYKEHISFNIKDEYKIEIQNIKKNKNKIQIKRVVKKNSNIPYNEINNTEILDFMIKDMMDNISPTDYKTKEIHLFACSLPVKYYGPGSYMNWLRLAWALKNTNHHSDERLFLTWLKITSNDNCRNTLRGVNNKFDWSNVNDLYEMWINFDNNTEGLTERSIMYWCKLDSPKQYKIIRESTIEYYINHTINNCTEFDLANVLYNIYKDRFICVSIKNNIWYEFKHQRWFDIDSGSTLRLCISKEMYNEYIKIIMKYNNIRYLTEDKDENKKIDIKIKELSKIGLLLKKTQWKNNIMREARELFYDSDFMKKIDSNPYLLCFNNCVIDFQNNECRKGLPNDYLTKCTNIDYVKYNHNKHYEIKNEIELFMTELFPEEELKKYMWDHLASILIGTNDNQTFNIYTGSGRNGKSCLVELISKCLGDYKGTVPITLITQKRTQIGGTSSEIVQLKGVRYAVMQEPSLGDKINEGIMKEITGGDPIQGRALFKDTITFIPQFKLVVCTNTLFDINSNDDGTWRRIRVCDFKSKFLDNPYEDEKFPKSVYPYQYKLNKKLAEQKFKIWGPIFLSLLVEISFSNKGIVKDTGIVLSSSNKYREGEDCYAEFCDEKIVREEGSELKTNEVWTEFKEWYSDNYGRNNDKTRKGLFNYIDNKFGSFSKVNPKGLKTKYNTWNNISLVEHEYDEL